MATITYESLLAEICPQVIDSYKQYQETGKRYGDLVGKGSKRTAEETKLMRLLGILIEDYDRRHAMPPDVSTPAERLQFLLDHSGKSSADLVSVFGQRSHVNEALTGKRAIGLSHARKLGQMFNVQPGLFL